MIYTGERTWQCDAAFRELVHGAMFAPFIPATEPLFLSLPGQSEQELVQHGSPTGQPTGPVIASGKLTSL